MIILKQATMKMAKTEGGVVSHVNKLVWLWEEVGLCIHKAAYATNGVGYVISHFNTGKIVLNGIATREKAEEYMQQLKEILEDWRFTEEEWDTISSDEKAIIKRRVDSLKNEILRGVK